MDNFVYWVETNLDVISTWKNFEDWKKFSENMKKIFDVLEILKDWKREDEAAMKTWSTHLNIKQADHGHNW